MRLTAASASASVAVQCSLSRAFIQKKGATAAAAQRGVGQGGILPPRDGRCYTPSLSVMMCVCLLRDDDDDGLRASARVWNNTTRERDSISIGI